VISQLEILPNTDIDTPKKRFIDRYRNYTVGKQILPARGSDSDTANRDKQILSTADSSMYLTRDSHKLVYSGIIKYF
jgi:hypothetical protein